MGKGQMFPNDKLRKRKNPAHPVHTNTCKLMMIIQPLSSLPRSLYRQQLTWTVTCWPFRTTCLSTTIPNMAAGLAVLTPLKVRPLLIWRMVGTFYMTLLFAVLLPLFPVLPLPFLLFFPLFRHISILSFLFFQTS